MINDEFMKLHVEKEKLLLQEQNLKQQRGQKIAWLAEQYGLLALPDDEIRIAFEKLASTHFYNTK